MTPEDRKKFRVLIGKPGLDGHDRGAKVIARALRDAGFEVIYSGLHQTPEMLVNVALQEDVDCIGLSILSGAHNTLMPEIVAQLEAAGASDIFVFGGGIIPDADIAGLKAQGVREIFTPGTSTTEVIRFLEAACEQKLEQAQARGEF
jgi:methylmalonyl-CoA mutase, C-terminal domain